MSSRIKLHAEEDTAENRLKRTKFIVEATAFERLSLWRETATASPHLAVENPVYWEQLDGWNVQVGQDYGRPVCVDITWALLDGHLVMFWEATSKIVNHETVRAWLEEHFTGRWDKGTRRAETNAMNFGHCLQALRQFTRERGEVPL